MVSEIKAVDFIKMIEAADTARDRTESLFKGKIHFGFTKRKKHITEQTFFSNHFDYVMLNIIKEIHKNCGFSVETTRISWSANQWTIFLEMEFNK